MTVYIIVLKSYDLGELIANDSAYTSEKMARVHAEKLMNGINNDNYEGYEIREMYIEEI